MLMMCGVEIVVHSREVHIVEGHCVRRRERNSIIAFDRVCDHLTSSALDDELMDLLIHLAIPGLFGLEEMPLGKNLSPVPQALGQWLYEPARRSLLGEHPSR